MRAWSSPVQTGSYVTDVVLCAFFILFVFMVLVTAYAFLRRLRNNALRDRMFAHTPAYYHLIQSIQAGQIVSDGEIQAEIPRSDFGVFELYLRERLVTTGTDPFAERHMANACGFLPAVRKKVRRHRNWAKAAHLHMLALLRDPADLDLFLDVLEHDNHPSCIFAAAIGLALGGHIASLPRIVARLYNPATPNRDQLLLVLAAYGPGRAPDFVGFLPSPDLPDAAAGVLADILGSWNHAPAKNALELRLASASDGDLKSHLIAALEIVGDRSTCGALRPYLQDPDFRVRLKTINALEHLGGREFLPEARALMDDPTPWVRRNAAEVLLRMGDEGRRILEAMAVSSNDEQRPVAKLALAEDRFGRIRGRFRHAQLPA